VLKHVTDLGQVIPSQSVERRYNYATYAEQVRAALELWGARVRGLISGERPATKVLTLRRRKGS
jgi:hypothetical protein